MNAQEEVDFLVVGSGGGGMAAAIVAADAGASTLVIEKSHQYGGTTALSGGVIWIPDNHLMRAAGLEDSADDGLAYLQQLTAGQVPLEHLRAYVEQGPLMLRHLEEHADVLFEAAPHYMDYYPELPGGRTGGRSLDPVPFSRRRLGRLSREQRLPTHGRILNRFSVTAREAHRLLDGGLGTYLFVARRLLQYYLDVPSRLRDLPDNRLTLGQALVGRLRKALAERRVPLWLETPAESLLVERGQVVGVRALRGGESIVLRARHGVLLAAGGFEHNTELRRAYQEPFLEGHWSAGSPDNQGEGIMMAARAGAALGGMHRAWWSPTFLLGEDAAMALISGKSMPGSLFVNSAGERFVNEAAPYEDVVKGQLACHRAGVSAVPCYMVFDARFRHHYPAGIIGPARAQPDHMIPQVLRDAGFLHKAPTLRALAQGLGVDPDGLERTVAQFNEHAARGEDPEYHRGSSLQDRYYADPRVTPNPSLAPLVEPPYYALTLYPGDLGTKGGVVCDEHARVLDAEGRPIPGLFATGNNTASIMADSYPGAGATIGPAMTFGYIAARTALGLGTIPPQGQEV